MALTIGNIACLMVIGRDFSKRSGLMTGVYVSGMSIGSMATTALTAPLAHVAGWRAVLALPGLFALVAIILWLIVQAIHKNNDPSNQGRSGSLRPGTHRKELQPKSLCRESSLLRHPVVWLLSIAFAAHTFRFFQP